MQRRRVTRIFALVLVAAAVGGAAVALWTVAKDRAPSALGAWKPVAEAIESALAQPAPPPSDASVDASGILSDASTVVHRQRTALSATQLGAPLVHGTFVPSCGAPDSMKVTVHVAVKEGRAVDVHATSAPPNPVVEGCVERAVRDLHWDISPQTSRVTVHY
jgi:hypothetical protein